MNDPRDGLSQQVIGLAIEVHRTLGPGLLESAYEECLCFELKTAGVDFARQVPLPVTYKSVKLDCGYRMDLVVDKRLVVELKTVEKLLPIHEAQLFDIFEAWWHANRPVAQFSCGCPTGWHQEAGTLMTFFSVPLCLCGSSNLPAQM